MNHRIGGVHQAIVFVASQPETRSCQITAEDANLGLQVLVETGEFQVQLQAAPEPELSFLRVARAHQYVERCPVIREKIGGDMGADVSGRSGQEYRHVAPLVPVLTAWPLLGAS